MCDSIANGAPTFVIAGGSGSCVSNVIIASNVLSTTGNVICANIIAGDGTFTGNLVSRSLTCDFLNVSSVINTGSLVSSGTVRAAQFIGAGNALSNINSSNITIISDLIPAIDNFYSIGSAAYRWKSVNIGPGTIFMTDTVLGTQAGITVTNGQLLTNNIGALVTGNLVLVDTATLVPTTITVNNGTMLLNNVLSIRTGNVNFIDSVTGYASTMNVQDKVVTFSNVSSVRQMQLYIRTV